MIKLKSALRSPAFKKSRRVMTAFQARKALWTAVLSAALAPAEAIAATPPITPEFALESFTIPDETDFDVARAPDGQFSAVWTGRTTPENTAFHSLYLRRFAANGSALAPEAEVVPAESAPNFPRVVYGGLLALIE